MGQESRNGVAGFSTQSLTRLKSRCQPEPQSVWMPWDPLSTSLVGRIHFFVVVGLRSLYSFFLFLKNIFLFFYFYFYFWLCWVFVAARGLFPSCGEQGLLFVGARGLLIVVASLVAEHGF